MEVIKSQKGKNMRIYNGVRFRKNLTNADSSVSWRCLHNASKRLDRIEVHVDARVELITPDNHAPAEASVKSRRWYG